VRGSREEAHTARVVPLAETVVAGAIPRPLRAGAAPGCDRTGHP
jgi:hypothetical protein